VAEFVDAVGYLKLGGFFVSFMSGNSTRLGVGIGTGMLANAGRAAGLIALFLIGVILGDSLSCGAAIGAASYLRFGAAVIWAAAVLVTVLAVRALALERSNA